jgi:mannose-6-phosphate isomerase
MTITPLDANQPADRFYRGGAKIDAFRRVRRGPDYRPEDWVGSMTPLAGQQQLGLSRLPDGTLLADAVVADAAWWLGDEHLAAFGANTMLLVKLLDAGQRLPVHAHPDDGFSRAHVGRPYGKVEAWYLLEGGVVHLGLTRDVDPEELRHMVDVQDTTGLLAMLHRRTVRAGDVVFVPAGELHAIGEGVFLLELQQPEDQSILLEWDGFALDGRGEGHLGLGFDVALGAVTTTGRSEREIDAWVRAAAETPNVFPTEADPYFRLERHVVAGEAHMEPGFAVVVVESGVLALQPDLGDRCELTAGSTAVIPHGAGRVRLGGVGTLLVCRPPTAPAR